MRNLLEQLLGYDKEFLKTTATKYREQCHRMAAIDGPLPQNEVIELRRLGKELGLTSTQITDDVMAVKQLHLLAPVVRTVAEHLAALEKARQDMRDFGEEEKRINAQLRDRRGELHRIITGHLRNHEAAIQAQTDMTNIRANHPHLDPSYEPEVRDGRVAKTNYELLQQS